MRVAQVFKRVLRLGRERVVGVECVGEGSGQRLLVEIARPRRRRLVCSGCGRPAPSVYDHQLRSWRHLDLARTRCLVRARIARVACLRCGVRAEAVPWARAGSRYTRPFEETCAFLAQGAPQSVVAALMRVDWATVGRICGRVVAEARAQAEGDGLEGLRRIGVDEVSYRAGHRYLTVVCDHDSGRVVWCAEGHRAETLAAFFRALGPERAGRLRAVSCDLWPAYLAVVRHHAPQAAICADPFHLVAKAQFCLDRVRARAWQRLRREDPEAARWLKGTRWALRRGPATRTPADLALIGQLEEANQDVYRAWLWCDQLRATLRHSEPHAAAQELSLLAAAAPGLGHPRFTRLGRTLARHAPLILNAVGHRLTNGRLEALNSTIRLLSHRARGFRRVDHLIALVHLVCGAVRVELPT
jgi:transposase